MRHKNSPQLLLLVCVQRASVQHTLFHTHTHTHTHTALFPRALIKGTDHFPSPPREVKKKKKREETRVNLHPHLTPPHLENVGGWRESEGGRKDRAGRHLQLPGSHTARSIRCHPSHRPWSYFPPRFRTLLPATVTPRVLNRLSPGWEDQNRPSSGPNEGLRGESPENWAGPSAAPALWSDRKGDDEAEGGV
jgi:hypothetical protein